MKTAIVGGGAAGYFAAVNLKEMRPDMEVCIFESGHTVLRKVKVSGGGRCNCTNTFRLVTDLCHVYPRGHRLMRRLMHEFSQEEAWTWFERHGVRLVAQDDECVFPAVQDSQAIIDCLTNHARRLGVELRLRSRIDSLEALLEEYDCVVVATGGSPRRDGLAWLERCGHEIEPPVPSLFSLSIADESLHALMGLVAETASVQLQPLSGGSKAWAGLKAEGALLITHWGVSGPAILRLSSYAARHLAEQNYRAALLVNWTCHSEGKVADELNAIASGGRQRLVANGKPFGLQQRLWLHIVTRVLGKEAAATKRWCDLSRKEMNRLVVALTADRYEVEGRAPFRDEFVTCGGVSLKSVSPNTLESRLRKGLYFAGEVLDIDGVTGGFNFQAAWTTAYVVARSIALLDS